MEPIKWPLAADPNVSTERDESEKFFSNCSMHNRLTQLELDGT
jgi:hypothetical protein